MNRRDFLAATATFTLATTADGRLRAAPPEATSLRAVRSARAASRELTMEQKELIIDAARHLMEEVYVHRTMKLAQYGIDPVPQLRALRSRAPVLSDAIFHREMRRIFVQLRDRHTHYISGEQTEAYSLPFRTARALDEGRWAYFVTRSQTSTLPIGSRIEAWNGGELDRVVEELAENVGAGNFPSRLAVARRSLTRRLTSHFDPPVENEVRLAITDPTGARKDVSFEWQIEPIRRKLELAPEHVFDLGIDEPHFLTSEPDDDEWVSSRTITVGGKAFGLLHIKNFHTPPNFMDVVVDRVKSLPQTGLVIDLRHNGGGRIQAGERLLQLFSQKRIEPHTFRSRASGTMAQYFSSSERAHRTIVQAMAFGSEFSADFPLTSTHDANDIHRVYFGPVVLLVDGITYSTADMFASGFQSHGIGKIVGVDDNIGAGGANNLKSYTHLLQRLPKADPRFPPLPNRVDFGFSIRQAIRKGPHYGLILEDDGIKVDHRYNLTKRDVLPESRDAELLEYACRLLQG
jgi:C-terminal processing protease CtpA/Prc